MRMSTVFNAAAFLFSPLAVLIATWWVAWLVFDDISAIVGVFFFVSPVVFLVYGVKKFLESERRRKELERESRRSLS